MATNGMHPLVSPFKFTVLIVCAACASSWVYAMGLMVEPAAVQCGVKRVAPLQDIPVQAASRLHDSQVARGNKDIAWAWLGTPTMRYPHKALGASSHAATLHVLLKPTANLSSQEIIFELPLNRVFEDRVPRLVDIDKDGRDEIVLIESDTFKGSSTVVYGVQLDNKKPALQERARSPFTGSTFRWLNPIGAADFDGDGKTDIASVITPHIGGMLTLYHYAPPQLKPFAQAMDTSNHRMGDVDQSLSVIVEQAGTRPTIIVPNMQLKALHALRWEAPGQWKELSDVMPLPATVQTITPVTGGGCIQLTNATWWRVTLHE